MQNIHADIVHPPPHLLLTQDGSGQRPVFIIGVKGFMILQHIGTNQGLVGSSVYIGDAVLRVICIAVVVLVLFFE